MTAIACLIGASTSMGCGFFGMMIATYSDARTTIAGVENVLKVQMILTALVVLPVISFIAKELLPEILALEGVRLVNGEQAQIVGTSFKAFISATMEGWYCAPRAPGSGLSERWDREHGQGFGGCVSPGAPR